MRRRLALVSLAVTAMLVVAFLVPLGLLVRSQAEDRALSRAQREAQAVASGLAVAFSLAPDAATRGLIEVVLAASGESGRMSVFLPDGSVVGTPAEQDDNVQRAAQGTAFTARTGEGAEVLIPVLVPSGAVVVRADVPSGELRSGVGRAWGLLALLGVALVGAAVLLADRLGRSLVRPVAELAAAAHSLGEGDLGTRVRPSGTPEVVELGAAFNQLAARLRDLLAAERESVADLSHRLRTPLTALRLQAETVREAEGGSSLLRDIERMERAVDSLIADARRAGHDVPAGASDLAAVVRHRVAFWSVLAEEQDRSVAVAVPDLPHPVGASADELGAVLDALLENVFSHTPPGSGFSVAVNRAEGGAALVVEDEGPGFADQAVVGRGESGSGSTGLGLDIARRAAEHTGGSLQIGSRNGGGGRVEVTFGPPSGGAGESLVE